MDCVNGLTFQNTEEWFRFFLQRGFAETYVIFPKESEIEDSVDNLLLTLRICKTIGPYKKASEEYGKKENSDLFQEYVRKENYLKFYLAATELAVIYLSALFEIFSRLKDGKDLTVAHRKRFRKIVQGADLSCPLEKNLLEKAKKELESADSQKALHNQETIDLVNVMAPKILNMNKIQTLSKDLMLA